MEDVFSTDKMKTSKDRTKEQNCLLILLTTDDECIRHAMSYNTVTYVSRASHRIAILARDSNPHLLVTLALLTRAWY